VSSPLARRDQLVAFHRGLNEAGFVEGRNVAVEYRWAEDRYDRLPELVSDLIRRRVTVIVTPAGTAAALAAKGLTTTTPIVFSTEVDPVRTGLVASLNRPGGNVTGIAAMGAEVATKQLGLLHELVPGATRFGVILNPTSPVAEPMLTDTLLAVSAIGRQIEAFSVRSNSDIDGAFASLAQKRVDGLIVAPNVLFITRRVQFITQAARHAVPVIYWLREFVEAGGLMSYGSSILDRERQLGIYAGRIIKGERPADMPVLRASKFEFVINLQTAKTIGLDIPPTLLARADEVIE
jgi:ABC-type uncharacterized transport system substrate-binding protein